MRWSSAATSATPPVLAIGGVRSRQDGSLDRTEHVDGGSVFQRDVARTSPRQPGGEEGHEPRRAFDLVDGQPPVAWKSWVARPRPFSAAVDLEALQEIPKEAGVVLRRRRGGCPERGQAGVETRGDLDGPVTPRFQRFPRETGYTHEDEGDRARQ
jgi:hypothetical protein